MYHGPREQVVPFFESLGFRLPPRKGTADFLQEITSRKDQQVRRPLRDKFTIDFLLRLSSLFPCVKAPRTTCQAFTYRMHLLTDL